MTAISSRVTTEEALDFEFDLATADTYRNRTTLFIALISVNFKTALTSMGNIEIYISDGQGKTYCGRAQHKTINASLITRSKRYRSPLERNS